MVFKLASRLFSRRSKKSGTMPRYFIQGKGELQLSAADFRAQGGEGAVYVRGATAYKIFNDPRRMIAPAKVSELAVLTHPSIIRPTDLLLDERSRPVGYAMRHVADGYALCQLFPKAFRARKNLTPEKVLALVERLREGVAHVHARGILVVDLNELNFLVAADFSEVYFIDVDSYQTPSFPATVLMESVRDRHAVRFDSDSDWFSFAVVTFQMFVGIHPFKGNYPPLQNVTAKEKMLDARMRANVSVLHTGVTTPASCLPFDVIPPVYLDWYRAVFEEGRRLPPPVDARATLTTAATHAPAIDDSSAFIITELRAFDGEVIAHDGLVTVTRRAVYFDGRRYAAPSGETWAVVTPRMRRLVAARLDGGRVRLRDLTLGRDLASELSAEAVVVTGGRLYVKHDASLSEVEFVELGGDTLAVPRRVGNVTPNSTQLFEGVAIQNLRGAVYASLLSSPGVCYQARLRELDGYQALDAKLRHNVLVVVGAKGGVYDRLVFRFDENFSGYDLRVAADVGPSAVNFNVLDTGVALLLNERDELEVFPRRKGWPAFESIRDAALGGDVKLFRAGARALFARGDRLYAFTRREAG